MRWVWSLWVLASAGCAVEPAPLLTIPPGHPGHAGSGETPYRPPPNPFKQEAAPPPSPDEQEKGHEHGKALCPVSDRKLGSMGEPAVLVHEGREIRFCCPACIPKFKEDPAGYLKKLDGAGHGPHGAPR